jgi:hypothetical protein
MIAMPRPYRRSKSFMYCLLLIYYADVSELPYVCDKLGMKYEQNRD